MALKTFVKINHINNLTDARYCAGMTVNLLGFCLNSEDPNFVSPEEFQEITGWLSGVEFVGETAGIPEEEIRILLDKYPGLSWVEHDRLDTLLSLNDLGLPLIYQCDLDEINHLDLELEEKLGQRSLYLHLTNIESAFQKQKEIQVLSDKFPVILADGFHPNDVLEVIGTLPVYGISLKGGTEIKAGLRDFDQMADILEALEIED
ncbi:phosphoribosylanthranilate isomerase [Algoriphagus confluentis]|uniref:Phosphoribosylanthranilate isomerase n=1 Tax=Algoriphagus confluentis TaxID=1697556 RepID=A0ABQ6PKM9_9BACT|nr:hypothetical protein Aconfl_11090 [Algoriphagus confluentis]